MNKSIIRHGVIPEYLEKETLTSCIHRAVF